jgi:hypothetical protein
LAFFICFCSKSNTSIGFMVSIHLIFAEQKCFLPRSFIHSHFFPKISAQKRIYWRRPSDRVRRPKQAYNFYIALLLQSASGPVSFEISKLALLKNAIKIFKSFIGLRIFAFGILLFSCNKKDCSVTDGPAENKSGIFIFFSQFIKNNPII